MPRVWIQDVCPSHALMHPLPGPCVTSKHPGEPLQPVIHGARFPCSLESIFYLSAFYLSVFWAPQTKNPETFSLLVSAQFIQEISEADALKEAQMWRKCGQVALVPGQAKIRRNEDFLSVQQREPRDSLMGM